MKYRFKCDVTVADIWKLTISETYHSMAGVCNIIFTVALIAMTLKLWGSVNEFFSVCMVFACCLFPVIQPLVFYMNAKQQVAVLPQNMELGFDEEGVHVWTKEKASDLPWKQITSIVRKQSLIILFCVDRRGYMLTQRTVGEQESEFFDYATKQIRLAKTEP